MEFSKEQQLLHEIIAEAWDNPSFKEELMATPIEAIKKLTGKTIKLPEGVNSLKVVDQSDATCTYINIPAKPDMSDMELTDDQLEIVSGGNGDGGGLTPPPSDNMTPGFTF